ncbi:hypothetical protein GGS21DRAFT_166769 [Xylaria nigripes]|nr:hypothetical protein GGS21DRAFT_166769 [Xylaria nigripes]
MLPSCLGSIVLVGTCGVVLGPVRRKKKKIPSFFQILCSATYGNVPTYLLRPLGGQRRGLFFLLLENLIEISWEFSTVGKVVARTLLTAGKKYILFWKQAVEPVATIDGTKDRASDSPKCRYR